MSIILIAAMDSKNCIGKNGSLPWDKPIPADIAHFKMYTLGEIVVMGRCTRDSIPSRFLKDRAANIILSRSKEHTPTSGVLVMHDPNEIRVCASLLQVLKKDIYIIGGGKLYREFLPDANRIYLTRVEGDFRGDTYFPEYNAHEWQITERREHKKDNLTEYNLEFFTLDRVAHTA